MGIVHFAPVGTSPGAGTSALSYLSHNAQAIIGDTAGDVVESVVIFCSPEVRDGEWPAEDYILNDYERANHRHGWKSPTHKPNVIEVIKDFLVDEHYLKPKGLMYAWSVDVSDYQASFNAIAKATLALARSDATGKHIWANLTGGTNVINAALMQVSSLSGLIGRMYYTFVRHEYDRHYLQPFSARRADFEFVWLPLIKTTYDYGYYHLLELLQDGEWTTGKALLSRLKSESVLFKDVDFTHFKRQYLNRMAGDVLEEQRGSYGESDRPIRLNCQGQRLLEYLHLNELTEALTRRDLEYGDLVQQCRKELESYRIL